MNVLVRTYLLLWAISIQAQVVLAGVALVYLQTLILVRLTVFAVYRLIGRADKVFSSERLAGKR